MVYQYYNNLHGTISTRWDKSTPNDAESLNWVQKFHIIKFNFCMYNINTEVVRWFRLRFFIIKHSQIFQRQQTALILQALRGYYTVARRYEFYFRVAKQYFTNERSEWVKYCFCHEKIKFISSSRPVMFFLLYRQKEFRREITEITSSINSRVRLWKINHSGPGCSFYEFYEWYIFQ